MPSDRSLRRHCYKLAHTQDLFWKTTYKNISGQIEAAYNQLKVQADELAGKLDSTNNKISHLQSSYESAAYERDEYKEQVFLSECKVSEIKSMLQKYEKINSDLESEVDFMKNQIWKLEGQIKNLWLIYNVYNVYIMYIQCMQSQKLHKHKVYKEQILVRWDIS